MVVKYYIICMKLLLTWTKPNESEQKPIGLSQQPFEGLLRVIQKCSNTLALTVLVNVVNSLWL